MTRPGKRVAKIAMWSLALAIGAFSARYLVFSAETLDRFEDTTAVAVGRLAGSSPQTLHVASHNRAWVILHVAAAMVALVLGPFQFLAALRAARPGLHRLCGRIYVAAALLGSVSGLPLSFLAFGHLPPLQRAAFLPTTFGFALLSLVWPIVTAMALVRARQRRFEDHRAWMMRSYSLTFAAVTTRLAAPVFLFLIRDPFASVNAAILTWPLNLVVAEWLIRRARRQPQLSTQSAPIASA